MSADRRPLDLAVSLFETYGQEDALRVLDEAAHILRTCVVDIPMDVLLRALEEHGCGPSVPSPEPTLRVVISDPPPAPTLRLVRGGGA